MRDSARLCAIVRGLRTWGFGPMRLLLNNEAKNKRVRIDHEYIFAILACLLCEGAVYDFFDEVSKCCFGIFEVTKNAPQQESAKHMAPKWKPTSDHFISNKTQRDATQHNTNPPQTLSLALGGAFQRRVRGMVNLPPGDRRFGRKETKKKGKKEVGR